MASGGLIGCYPAWKLRNETCPFGKDVPLPFAFTMPFDPDFLDVIAMGYSCIPAFLIFGIQAWVVINFARHRKFGLFEVVTWCLYPLVLGLEDYILKAVVKLVGPQPRPLGSCDLACGMPSGHALMSYGLLTWMLLELNSRTHIRKPFAWTVFLLLLILPIPWARVQLNDHSVMQVVVGCVFGVVTALAFFAFLRVVMVKHLSVATCNYTFRDNYSPGMCS
mmetsp:Transcript_29958/g.79899  ORF Transcript_29958/g.79899 Transcript_29958/m.79899 type:complete len:221 (-) Transcript_29958:242-904(-)